MAAYASVVSLLNTMEQIQNHPRLSTCFNKFQLKSLGEKVDFFLDFVNNYSDVGSREAKHLVRRIGVMAHTAEDIIECQASIRVQYSGSTQKCPGPLLDLQRIIEEDMSCLEVKIMKFNEKMGCRNSYSVPAPPHASAAPTENAAAMVGFEGYLVKLLDELTGQDSDRRIISIVGMGGLGKTTLAKNVYENLYVVHHFDVCAWVTVSQEYNARNILVEALCCLGRTIGKNDGRNEDELGVELHKTLSGRRYLIVLDDVWSVEVWDKMKFFFPENNNGSRIVVTTRETKLVASLGSSALALDFLDENKSWDLFCHKAFGQQAGCPVELEETGKRIVSKCKGLPLAIVVIGGLLGKSSRTKGYWEKIAKDISSVLNHSREGNKVLSILRPSYKHLPACLKPCFLYLGLFPEDYEISVAKLIKLWVAEGFIKPNADQRCEEETAEDYIKELVDRSLLLVRRYTPHKRFGTCFLHDLVRDLSIKIAAEENFVCLQRYIDGVRHLVVDARTNSCYYLKLYSRANDYLRKLYSIVPSLVDPRIVFWKRRNQYSQQFKFKIKLLRVLFRYVGNIDYIFQERNLRYLSHESTLIGLNRIRRYNLPSSISLLWSLQTLMITGIVRVVAPLEIWEMPQLRHIEIGQLYLPHPRSDKQDVVVLQKLQTLKTVVNFKCSKEVCKRIPNIKELGLGFEPTGRRTLHNIGSLTKLETLQFSLRRSWTVFPTNPLKNFKLLTSLRELTLDCRSLVWRDMKILGSLPRLEVLNLSGRAVVGPQWNSVEERFLSLKHLQITGCGDLICWIADCSHFLVLETLSLEFLDEIPSGIGEIATLERIEMAHCSDSTFVSAIKILEEQESLGNESLRLHLKFFNQTEANKFTEIIQQEGFTTQNFHITCMF